MKIQIRKNVFETNSSTQHTLTICNRNTDYSDYVGKTIILGKDVPKDLFWSDKNKCNPLYKFQMLWVACIGYNTDIRTFIHNMKLIKSTFEKIGINIELNYDESVYDEWEYYGEDIDVIKSAFNSEEDLINFVFNQDSWYDSYEDNYGECPYENDIKEGNKTYWDRN